jgi:hypothetical protein
MRQFARAKVPTSRTAAKQNDSHERQPVAIKFPATRLSHYGVTNPSFALCADYAAKLKQQSGAEPNVLQINKTTRFICPPV